MHDKFMDFFEAWSFLADHPSFREDFGGFKDHNFQGALDIAVVKVHPKANRVCDVAEKNTKTQVWLECGAWMSAEDMNLPNTDGFHGAFSHDVKLDCGGDTFEKAIIKLSNLVLKNYGDY